MENTNLFLALTKAQCERGDDMELVAQELAKALESVIKYGTNFTSDEELAAEFTRLRKLSSSSPLLPRMTTQQIHPALSAVINYFSADPDVVPFDPMEYTELTEILEELPKELEYSVLYADDDGIDAIDKVVAELGLKNEIAEGDYNAYHIWPNGVLVASDPGAEFLVFASGVRQ